MFIASQLVLYSNLPIYASSSRSFFIIAVDSALAILDRTLLPFSSVLPTYESFAQQKGFVPNAVTLPEGATGLWIGDPDAQDLVVFFVGKVSEVLTY